MYKKVIIQLLLTAILFGISIFVFFKYFTSDEKEIKETNKEINKIISSEEIDSETGTLIKGTYFTNHYISYYKQILMLIKVEN